MAPYILVSILGGMDVTQFRNPVKAAGFCSKLERLGIAYDMVVY